MYPASMRILVLAAMLSACAGSSNSNGNDCELLAQDIRTKGGTRAKGICASTQPDDVTRFGPACATLKKCQGGETGDLFTP